MRITERVKNRKKVRRKERCMVITVEMWTHANCALSLGKDARQGQSDSLSLKGKVLQRIKKEGKRELEKEKRGNKDREKERE